LKDLLKCWGCALDAFLYQQYSNRIYRRSTCNNRCKNLLISLEGQQIKGKNFIVKAIRPKVLCNIFSIISYQNVNSFIRCRKFLFLAQISSQIVSANLARTAWWFSSFCIFPFTLNSLIYPHFQWKRKATALLSVFISHQFSNTHHSWHLNLFVITWWVNLSNSTHQFYERVKGN